MPYVYGCSIAGAKLLLTAQDRKALNAFFNNTVYNEEKTTYLSLSERWQSTTQLSSKLGEYQKRTKNRLQKLLGLGLVYMIDIEADSRIDYYWYISQGGIYYIFSALERPKLVRFLETNGDKMREFGFIQELVAQNRPEASHLINNLKNFARARQYHQMVPFVHDLIGNIFENKASYLPPYRPNIKDTIRENYGIETIRKLESRFGKILEGDRPNPA